MALTQETVQNALKQIIDPNTGRDLMTTKSAKNIKIDGESVSLDVVLGYPAKSQIEPMRKIVSEKLLRPRCVYGLFPANSFGDDVELYTDATRSNVLTKLSLIHISEPRD